MDWLADYGFFFLKIITIALAVVFVAYMIANLQSKTSSKKNRLVTRDINEYLDELESTVRETVLTKDEFKVFAKQRKKQSKRKEENLLPKLFVLNFQGDLKASAVDRLREEVTAILTVAKPEDQVMVKLDSPGGVVPNYGLAASQLKRLREKRVPITASVDRIAASGGYLIASVADKIIAAPFSIVGSIGVLTQFPNFHRFLDQHNIDIEHLTAGEYKSTLTMLGENTNKGREKVKADIEAVHRQFKAFIHAHRPNVDIDRVSTGEYWLAADALPLGLVDEIMTSDDYLLSMREKARICEVSYYAKKGITGKISSLTSLMSEKLQGFVL